MVGRLHSANEEERVLSEALEHLDAEEFDDVGPRFPHVIIDVASPTDPPCRLSIESVSS